MEESLKEDLRGLLGEAARMSPLLGMMVGYWILLMLASQSPKEPKEPKRVARKRKKRRKW
ncbi:hypothetical protein [Tellurirhabdus rosea]|uniref:hypothetical protein n=1 Tax=Tellurirhabdus rosea TaxID=2674997 RepID=UPI0022530E84|nr:hypothetical protein [Tellurirhabdus rosea]